MKLRKPIRLKILAVVSIVLVAGLSVYVLLAIQTFKKDKIELIYDMNKSSSTDFASEINSSLQAVVNDFKLYVEAYGHLGAQNTVKTFKSVLEDDPLLVDIAMYKNGPQDGVITATHLTQNSFLTQNQITQEYFARELPSHRPIPFDQINNDTVAVWNATVPKGPPLIGIGIKIVQTGSGKSNDQLYAAGYIKADRFLKSLGQNALTKAFLVDKHGQVLIYPEATVMANGANLEKHPLVKQSISKPARQAVMKFSDSGQEYIGAYASVGFAGLTVITQTEYGHAFAAIGQLVKRSLVFALAIIAFSFLVTMIFSQTLTGPLTRLTDVMKDVSTGNLDADLEITTDDEIGILTGVFNQMIGDLKDSRNQLLELNKSLEEKVKERTKQLEEMAVRDPLTGMYNRRYFNDKLKEELARSGRTNKPVSIVYLDIDHFKKYNDGNGHPEGDELLKMFAKVITAAVRKTDTSARLGGEEFCIILPDTPLEGALEAAEKVRKAVESTDFPHGEKQPMGRVTCSLGVSEYPRFGKDEEEIVKSADTALYHVKEGGRNRVGAPVASDDVTMVAHG